MCFIQILQVPVSDLFLKLTFAGIPQKFLTQKECSQIEHDKKKYPAFIIPPS